jgi:hypothetical protein
VVESPADAINTHKIIRSYFSFSLCSGLAGWRVTNLFSFPAPLNAHDLDKSERVIRKRAEKYEYFRPSRL